jgi:hypothetical protein
VGLAHSINKAVAADLWDRCTLGSALWFGDKRCHTLPPFENQFLQMAPMLAAWLAGWAVC